MVVIWCVADCRDILESVASLLTPNATVLHVRTVPPVCQLRSLSTACVSLERPATAVNSTRSMTACLLSANTGELVWTAPAATSAAARSCGTA